MEPKKIVDDDGSIYYLNEFGDFHREDGPAFIATSGYQAWWLNGKRHRTNGPALVSPDRKDEFWIYGNYYSTEKVYQEAIKELGLFQSDRKTKNLRFSKLEIR